MTTSEQRNRNKGSPQRPWVRIRFVAPDGTLEEVVLLADTGNPCAVIVSSQAMAKLKLTDAPDVDSNFGLLEGGWLRLTMPELGLDQEVMGFASNGVAMATKGSSPDFDGLAGLPFLRLLEYGGDAEWFWLRAAASRP